MNGDIKPQVASTPVRVVKLSQVNSSQSSSSQLNTSQTSNTSRLNSSLSKDDIMDAESMNDFLDEEMEM